MLLKLALGNVRKSFGDFGIYFLTVALAVAIFYAFGAITDQEAVQTLDVDSSTLIDLLSYLIGGVSVFIVFILAFLVVYANRFLIRRRKREFGIYLLLGMRTRQVAAVVVLETAIAWLASFAAGLAAGWAVSVGLMHVIAALFGGTVPGFIVGFSSASLARTLAAFGGIFLLAALANTRSVMRARLIDLIRAARENEPVALRSIPVSVALFIASCTIIAVSYRLLLDNGLLEPSPEFLAATVLVCVGTGLFFYSLSGFLLAVGRAIRPLYLRGLNMFTLRQLGSKVNSTSASAAVICLALFLAITSACGGFGIVDALRTSLERTTAYDATAASNWTDYPVASGQEEPDPIFDDDDAYARTHGFDMESGLRDSASLLGYDFDALVGRSAQMDTWIDLDSPITLGDLDALNGRALADYVNGGVSEGYRQRTLDLMPLSQANAALALAGKPAIELDAGACVIVADFEYVKDYYRDLAGKRPMLAVGGRRLALAGFEDLTLMTSAIPSNTGTLVVPDDAIPASAVRGSTMLDMQAAPGADQGDLAAMLGAIAASDDGTTWPMRHMTRQEVYDQSLGLSGVVAFLAIYIGLVLTIACAAVIAIQQLTEASDGVRRYRLLRKLGAPERMVGSSQLAQVAACFLLPLALALAHTACALQVVTDVVAAFGHMEIGTVALATVGAFLAVYGMYLLTTFAAARRLTR